MFDFLQKIKRSLETDIVFIFLPQSTLIISFWRIFLNYKYHQRLGNHWLFHKACASIDLHLKSFRFSSHQNLKKLHRVLGTLLHEESTRQLTIECGSLILILSNTAEWQQLVPLSSILHFTTSIRSIVYQKMTNMQNEWLLREAWQYVNILESVVSNNVSQYFSL